MSERFASQKTFEHQGLPGRLRVAMGKPWRFLTNYSFFAKAWFLPVWFMLGLAKLAIFTVSFKRLGSRLGVPVGNSPWIPLVDSSQQIRAKEISRVVQVAARYTPWDSNCFPQAIVARLLLGWYGVPYCIYFGVRKPADSKDFDAHAWVASGRIRVAGRSSFARYTVVAVFAEESVARALASEG